MPHHHHHPRTTSTLLSSTGTLFCTLLSLSFTLSPSYFLSPSSPLSSLPPSSSSPTLQMSSLFRCLLVVCLLVGASLAERVYIFKDNTCTFAWSDNPLVIRFTLNDTCTPRGATSYINTCVADRTGQVLDFQVWNDNSVCSHKSNISIQTNGVLGGCNPFYAWADGKASSGYATLVCDPSETDDPFTSLDVSGVSAFLNTAQEM